MHIKTHASEQQNTEHHDYANVPAAFSEQNGQTGELEAEYFPPSATGIRTVQQLNAFFAENFDAVGEAVRRRCFHTPDQTDDVTQEVYPRMLRFMGQTSEGIREPWAALSIIARHLAVDELRRSFTHSRRFTSLHEDTFVPPAHDDALVEEFDESTHERLRDAINLLSARERHVITEVFLNGKRGRQVASELGLSESYIAELKAAGLAKLRQHLQEKSSDEALPPFQFAG